MFIGRFFVKNVNTLFPVKLLVTLEHRFPPQVQRAIKKAKNHQDSQKCHGNWPFLEFKGSLQDHFEDIDFKFCTQINLPVLFHRYYVFSCYEIFKKYRNNLKFCI